MLFPVLSTTVFGVITALLLLWFAPLLRDIGIIPAADAAGPTTNKLLVTELPGLPSPSISTPGIPSLSMSKKLPVTGCQFEGRIGSPIIEKVDAKLKLCPPEPITLAGVFSDTEIKLYEADFFLKFIEQNAFHHALILYGLSAFLTAARSITLFLQAECKGKPGFG